MQRGGPEQGLRPPAAGDPDGQRDPVHAVLRGAEAAAPRATRALHLDVRAAGACCMVRGAQAVPGFQD